MKVSIHQPHYWPWLGYLRKMKEVDIFVYLDNANYTKNGFINRNRIEIDGKDYWLTIPVLTKGRMGQAIKNVKVNWDANWSKKHYHTIRQAYTKEMRRLEPDTLIAFFHWSQYKLLIQWCVESVRFLRIAYKIENKVVFESTLGVGGVGTERLVNICEALNADTYLSGPSGRDYLDEAKFGNIKVEYMDWKPKGHLSALHYYLKNDVGALEDE